jgi:hypothetical protein
MFIPFMIWSSGIRQWHLINTRYNGSAAMTRSSGIRQEYILHTGCDGYITVTLSRVSCVKNSIDGVRVRWY